jgi:hypothetical protein
MRILIYIILLTSLTTSGLSTAFAEALFSEQITIGIAEDGSLIDDELGVGIVYDTDGFGQIPAGGNLIYQGTVWEVWGLEYFANERERATVDGLPEVVGSIRFTWTDLSSSENMVWLTGQTESPHYFLDAEFLLSLTHNVLWITFAFTSKVDISDLWISRSVDPDIDAVFDNWDTYNSAGSGYAWSASQVEEKAMALVATEGIGGVCEDWCELPSEILEGIQFPIVNDGNIGVALYLGDLLTDETREATFVYAFAATGEEARSLGEWALALTDRDEDGVDDDLDCDERNPLISPDSPELPDGLDNDCDLLVDEETSAYDDDGDGYNEAEGDCDDDNEWVYPGAEPVEGIIDADCDGVSDSEDWRLPPQQPPEIEPDAGLANDIIEDVLTDMDVLENQDGHPSLTNDMSTEAGNPPVHTPDSLDRADNNSRCSVFAHRESPMRSSQFYLAILSFWAYMRKRGADRTC